MNVTFDNKFAKLFIGIYIGYDRHIIQSIRDIDQILHTDNFVIIRTGQCLTDHGLQYRLLILGERIKALCEVIQLIQSGRVKSEVIQFGNQRAVINAELNIRIVYRCDPCSLQGIGDFVILARHR